MRVWWRCMDAGYFLSVPIGKNIKGISFNLNKKNG